MSNVYHVAYIGIINYKEIYYSTISQEFTAYNTDVLKGTLEEVNRKKRLMDFSQQTVPAFAPLAAILFYLFMQDRITGIPTLRELPGFVYYAIAAIAGLLPAIKLKKIMTGVWENHFMDGERAADEDVELAVKELKRNNRLFAVFRLVILLGTLIPVILKGKPANVFLIFGYACVWFMLYIMYAFRPFTCWTAELQLRNKKK